MANLPNWLYVWSYSSELLYTIGEMKVWSVGPVHALVSCRQWKSTALLLCLQLQSGGHHGRYCLTSPVYATGTGGNGVLCL